MINFAFTVYRTLVCAPRRVVTAIAVLIIASSMAMAQPTGVGEGWQVRADDQGLRIGESGFLIPNVTVEDRNGDLVGDQPYILRATGIWNGVRYYARAEVTIRSGMLSEVTNASFTFTTEPPDLPTVLQFQVCDATLEAGQATLCGVQALRNDGTIEDVTTAPGTTFISSDPSILSVDDAGVVTGVRAGAGFITATNDGVSTTKIFFVRTPTVETMVEGFLQLPDGEPAAGVSVTTAGGGAVSDAAGRFTIPLMLPAGQLISLAALGQVGGQSYAGAKTDVEATPDGITDAGLITLAPQDQPVWTARLPLFNRVDDIGAYAVAFDSDRGVLVLSGAARSRGELHTWERDAAGGWRLRAVEPHYGPLHGMQTVYDAGRQRVVRVSLGLDDVTLTPVVRTQEWNGVAWALRSTDGPTPAWDISSTDVSSFGLAYDAVRAVTYYVGDNEFWEWDGDAWTAQPASLPAGRKAIVRDSARDRLIAFAVDAFTERLSIWEFDGTAWQSRPIPYNIIVFLISTMSAVYDPAQNVTWLSVANGFGGQQERYRWDGATLQLAAQGTSYVSGTDPALYFDSVAQQAMSYSGFRLTSHGSQAAVNVLRTLAEPPAVSEMLAARQGPMIFDEARQRCMLVGGGPSEVPVDDWIWDGAAWSRSVPSVHPANRGSHGLTYDPGRGAVLLHGGAIGATAQADTWIWDGSAWTQVATTGPAARLQHGLVFDRARNVAVLFGGQSGSNPITYFGDTWEWDGSTWTQVATTGPSPRSRFQMAYDEARGVTLLVGGAGSVPFSGGTWEWDGATWTQHATPGSLASAKDSSMAYDAVRERCVLYYGDASGFGQLFEWDGNTWTPRAASGLLLPTSLRLPAMAFDRARGVMVFGGLNGEGVHTWEFGAP